MILEGRIQSRSVIKHSLVVLLADLKTLHEARGNRAVANELVLCKLIAVAKTSV
jgi:hypothetical protein